MSSEIKNSTDILYDFLNLGNVTQVLVIGKDGFAIETVGNFKAANLEKLCSSLATAINGMEEMSQDLNIGVFKNMTFEYDGAFIVGATIKDAVIALIAPDASSVGMMKLSLNKHMPNLESFF